MKTLEFEKSITLNDYEVDTVIKNVNRLLFCMRESNYQNQAHTEYFRLRLKDSEIGINAKELVLEWAAVNFEDPNEKGE